MMSLKTNMNRQTCAKDTDWLQIILCWERHHGIDQTLMEIIASNLYKTRQTEKLSTTKHAVSFQILLNFESVPFAISISVSLCHTKIYIILKLCTTCSHTK